MKFQNQLIDDSQITWYIAGIILSAQLWRAVMSPKSKFESPIDTRSTARSAWIATGLTALLVAGCGKPSPAQWSTYDSSRGTKVVFEEDAHGVARVKETWKSGSLTNFNEVVNVTCQPDGSVTGVGRSSKSDPASTPSSESFNVNELWARNMCNREQIAENIDPESLLRLPGIAKQLRDFIARESATPSHVHGPDQVN